MADADDGRRRCRAGRRRRRARPRSPARPCGRGGRAGSAADPASRVARPRPTRCGRPRCRTCTHGSAPRLLAAELAAQQHHRAQVLHRHREVQLGHQIGPADERFGAEAAGEGHGGDGERDDDGEPDEIDRLSAHPPEGEAADRVARSRPPVRRPRRPAAASTAIGDCGGRPAGQPGDVGEDGDGDEERRRPPLRRPPRWRPTPTSNPGAAARPARRRCRRSRRRRRRRRGGAARPGGRARSGAGSARAGGGARRPLRRTTGPPSLPLRRPMATAAATASPRIAGPRSSTSAIWAAVAGSSDTWSLAHSTTPPPTSAARYTR